MEKICEVSNPKMVLKQLEKYYGDEVDLYLSTSKNKKYMVFDEQGKKIHFGSILYEDYTKHKDKKRRKNYLKRAGSIRVRSFPERKENRFIEEAKEMF